MNQHRHTCCLGKPSFVGNGFAIAVGPQAMLCGYFLPARRKFSLDMVHEHVKTQLPVKHLTASFLHYSYPTPAHYWRKLTQYSQAWALQRFSSGQHSSTPRALLSGFFAFIKSYIVRLGFLDGWAGLNVCIMQAQAAYGKYLTLYWLWVQHKAK